MRWLPLVFNFHYLHHTNVWGKNNILIIANLLICFSQLQGCNTVGRDHNNNKYAVSVVEWSQFGLGITCTLLGLGRDCVKFDCRVVKDWGFKGELNCSLLCKNLVFLPIHPSITSNLLLVQTLLLFILCYLLCLHHNYYSC